MKKTKKILLWTVAAPMILATGFVAINFSNETAKNYEIFKKSVSELHGLRPKESQEEVLYSMGKPDYVYKDDNSRRYGVSELPIGTNINDYLIWEWLPKSGHPNNLNVEFDPSSKLVLMVSCFENPYMPACHTIAGISSLLIGGSEDYIVDRLGPADDVSYSNEGGTELKFLFYKSLGLHFTMKEGHIVVIRKGEADPDFFWWFRHSPSW